MLFRIDAPGDQYNPSVRKFANPHFETSANLAGAFRVVSPICAFLGEPLVRHTLVRLVSKKEASKHALLPLTPVGLDYYAGGSFDKES
jgi:hypothetical protein